MKYFILILGLMIASSAHGKTIETPAWAKGATVTVTLKSGKTYSFSAETHAVVPREQEDGPEMIPLEDAQMAVALHRELLMEQFEASKRPNTVKLYGGAGLSQLDTSSSPTSMSVKQSVGGQFGVGYERDLSDEVSLDVLGYGNGRGVQGGLLGLGYKF